MTKDKISDYDGVTAGNNTDIGGISIDEGMLPSTVNNSLRELTKQLGAFADGTDGIDVLTLHDDDASASIKFQAPATVTTTTTFTLPDGDGTNGYALVTNGSGTLSWASAGGLSNVSEDTTPELGGALSTSGNNIEFGDSSSASDDRLTFGASADLSIYHDTNASYIVDSGTGSLNIHGTDINLRDADGNSYINMSDNGTGGTVTLKHNTATKLNTKTDGILITGELQADSLDINGAADIAGTVTADGLTVDGGITTTTSGVALDVTEADSGSDAIIGIVANGSARSQIRSTHTLGTSSDLRMLTRDSGGTTKERIKINDNGDISFYADNGTTQGLFWDASTQRLGLGETSPANPLHVVGSDGNTEGTPTTNADTVAVFQNNGLAGDSSIVQVISGTTGVGQVVFGDADDNIRQAIRADQSDDSLEFRTGNNSVSMHITSGGNVGIGTDSPTDILHVKSSGGSGYIKLDNSSGGERIFLGSEAGISAIYSQTSSGGNQPLKFATGSSERMRIDSSGNVGIGTTSPSAGLHIDNPDNSAITAILDTDNSAVKIVFRNNTETGNNVQIGADGSALVANTGGTERMRITSGGGLGIGKTAAGESQASGSGYFFAPGSAGYSSHVQTASTGNYLSYLHRNGTSGGMILFKNNDSSIGSITNSTTGITYNTTSDIRLKTDIAPIADATDKLMAMNAVSHKWKADPDADAVVGFIAQEMAEIVPEAVSGDADSDEMMSMDYGRITPVLVAALQDAHRKIEQLEQRIADMETE